MKVYMVLEEHESLSEMTHSYKVMKDAFTNREDAEELRDACRAALAECVGSDTVGWTDGYYMDEDDYYNWKIRVLEVEE